VPRGMSYEFYLSRCRMLIATYVVQSTSASRTSASTAGQGLVPFLDQLIFFKNSQLGSYLAG
jgi:hypothetical protein